LLDDAAPPFRDPPAPVPQARLRRGGRSDGLLAEVEDRAGALEQDAGAGAAEGAGRHTRGGGGGRLARAARRPASAADEGGRVGRGPPQYAPPAEPDPVR